MSMSCLNNKVRCRGVFLIRIVIVVMITSSIHKVHVSMWFSSWAFNLEWLNLWQLTYRYLCINNIFLIFFFQNIKSFRIITFDNYMVWLLILNFKTLSIRNIVPYIWKILCILKKLTNQLCLLIWKI